MKRRSFFSVLIASVLVLLLISASSFYWLTSRSPLRLLGGGVVLNPTATIFVSKQAPAMASLLVNPDKLEAFRLLMASPGERRRSRDELDRLKETLLANTNLDYHQDIQPWLDDEITVALTTPDLDRDRQNGFQPGYLLVATSKNGSRSREFLQLFWQKQALAGTDLVFEQYKGIKLIYNNPQSVTPIANGSNGLNQLRDRVATAVVGDRFVLFANDPKVLREAINNVQVPNLSLNDSAAYQSALEKLTQPRIGLTFINIDGAKTALGIPESDAEVYESLAIALELNRQGLIADTALFAAPDADVEQSVPPLSQPVPALEFVPKSSSLVAAGTDLNRLWNQISTAVATEPQLFGLLNQSLASLETAWGIGLPQDIFSWVNGEYALAVIPRPDRDEPDWLFVVEKSSPDADASIEHLDELAKARGFSVGALPVENQTIMGWTKLIAAPVNAKGIDKTLTQLQAQVQGVHTTVGRYEIFASSTEAIDRAKWGMNESLLKSDSFKAAIAPISQPNDGYLYINWQSSQPIIEHQLPIMTVVDLVAKPVVSHLRSLTASSYGSEDGVQRSRLFFRLF